MSEKIMDVNGYQIFNALNSLTKAVREQIAQQKSNKPKELKGLDFRFVESAKIKTDDEKKTAMERIKEL